LDFERVLAFVFDFIKTECKKAHGWTNSASNSCFENLVTISSLPLVNERKSLDLVEKKGGSLGYDILCFQPRYFEEWC
jgi:hypothetical protein